MGRAANGGAALSIERCRRGSGADTDALGAAGGSAIGLIGYGERLWFSNSVLFTNYNSADVYSYDPATGGVRYEAHLFTQAVGDPAVLNGLLYWPFEDPRSSTGRAEFMVTDGVRWNWLLIPHWQAFHLHALHEDNGTFVAATSAWRGVLHRSHDGGSTWETIYEHPSPSRQVSRFTSLAAFKGDIYAGLTAWREAGIKLYRVSLAGLETVPGWPEGRSVTALTPFGGWLYALNGSANELALWRTDGTRAERITALDGQRVRALAADERLWAVAIRPGGGDLWASDDGLAWRRVQSFEGAEPADIAAYGGRIYVGMIEDGGGSLWRPSPPAPVEPVANAPEQLPATASDEDAAQNGLSDLADLLADAGAYKWHAGGLRERIRTVGMSSDPTVGAALTMHLDAPAPDDLMPLFGGAVTVPAAVVARWYVLWGLAFNGHGQVSPELISVPWGAETNRSEKYLEPAPMAMWAAARIGRRDDALIAALIEGLGRPGEPNWLDGDRIGALTALTGQRFGYDLGRWRDWWAATR